MVKREFYDGMEYTIEYKPHLSNGDYTSHTVYHITTEDTSYNHTYEAVKSIMNDDSFSEEEWRSLRNSVIDAFHPYHKFSFDKDENVYVYDLVKPYDD
jgi:hypothetical protein